MPNVLNEVDEFVKANPIGLPGVEDVPVLSDHEAVIAAGDRLADVLRRQAAAEKAVADLAAKLGADATATPATLRARAVVRGGDASATLALIDQLGAAREEAAVYVEAVAIARNDLAAAQQLARREMGEVFRSEVWKPIAREVSARLASLLSAHKRLNDVTDRARANGVAGAVSALLPETFSPHDMIGGRSLLRSFAAAGLLDADTIEPALRGEV